MKNIAKRIIEGREAEAKLLVKEAEVDSCWIKVEEYKAVADSLKHAAVLADRQKDLKDKLLDNKDAQIDELDNAVKKEKVQKWGILGGGAAAVVLVLGLLLGLR